MNLYSVKTFPLIAIAFGLTWFVSASQLCAQNEASPLYGLRRELSTLIVRDSCLSTLQVNVMPEDEVWLVLARDCHLDPDNLSLIGVRQLQDGQWKDANLETLISAHANDKTKSTMLYVHGHRTDEEWAKDRGLQFYGNTFSDNHLCRPPVRFIIFAWKSERSECRASLDYREKSQRAIVVGRTLANVLCQFGDRNLVLAGFSLGTQAILSALCQPAIQLDPPPGMAGQYRVALIAPALDGCYAAAQRSKFPKHSAVARAEIFDNRADRALRISKIIRRVQAPAGDVAIAELARRGNLPLAPVKVQDVARTVGKGHSVDGYTSNPLIHAVLNDMLSQVHQTQP